MNRSNLKDARAIKLLGVAGLFVVAASLPVLARAQDLPLTAAPENRVQSAQATGGAGYAAPDNVYVPPSSVERSERKLPRQVDSCKVEFSPASKRSR